MNKGKYVFAQLVEFLDHHRFEDIVKKYDGNKGIRGFTCWNQMLCMIFGQLSARESLRDLMVVLQAHKSKSYHLGLGSHLCLTTLSRANINRSYKIYEEFATHMIGYARRICRNDDFEIKVEGNIYAFDSSTIDLCLSVFWWATFRKRKGAIKMHTLYDVKTHIPSFLHITPASVNDIKAMDYIPYEPGSYYIFDRGYNDFERLYNIYLQKAFFVFRARDNLKFRRIYSIKADRTSGVRSDQIGVFTSGKSPERYPEKIRRVKYYDSENDIHFTFLTNNFTLTVNEIALLYKNRWQVELFFKWIKQHLKVKSFWGYTENAVRTQIYCAVIAYCLVSIVAHELKIDRSIYEILQILGISLTDKTPVKELLTSSDYKNIKEPDCNLLLFN
jgi:FOG: Transposase and inactivated derivatives